MRAYVLIPSTYWKTWSSTGTFALEAGEDSPINQNGVIVGSYEDNLIVDCADIPSMYPLTIGTDFDEVKAEYPLYFPPIETIDSDGNTILIERPCNVWA